MTVGLIDKAGRIPTSLDNRQILINVQDPSLNMWINVQIKLVYVFLMKMKMKVRRGNKIRSARENMSRCWHMLSL